MLAATGFAAAPTPDRPMVSRTGQLAAEDTLEMELGVGFEAGPLRSAPTAFKYSFGGIVEPRLMTNLGGFENGFPQLAVGVKVRLFSAEGNHLSMWIASRIPVSDLEPWQGQFHGLFTTELSDVVALRINGGLDFVQDASGTVTFGGAPLTAALSMQPVERLRIFVELAGRAGGPECDGLTCAYGDLIANVGAMVAVTEGLTLDGALGYAGMTEQPRGMVGITANFGRLDSYELAP